MDTEYIPRPPLEQPFIRILKSDQEPRILNLHSTIEGEAIGGMGKTRLLEHYGQLCTDRGIRHTEILDFRLAKNCSRRKILDHVHDVDPDSFPEYTKRRAEYDAYVAAMPRGAVETVPVLADLGRKVDDGWLLGCGRLLTKGQVVVRQDTWEAIAATELAEWWREMLLRLEADFAEEYKKLVLVIAGRLPLHWRAVPTKLLAVGPFTLDETAQYAQSRGYVEEGKPVTDLVQAVHTASKGHPVLVAWAFDYGDRGVGIQTIAAESAGDFATFRRRLVEETCKQCDPTLSWSVCLYRRFNVPILRHITGWNEKTCKQKIQQLQSDWPSIVRRGADEDSCEPHDAARELLLEYSRPMIDAQADWWRGLRRKVIEYYQQELEKSPADRIERGKHHAYLAEQLFYRLDDCVGEQDEQSCFEQAFHQHFLPKFDDALSSYQLGLARLLLGEVTSFLHHFPDQLKDRSDISRAKLLMRDQKFSEALAVYNDVNSRAEGRDDLRVVAEVQTQIGRLYSLQWKYDLSLQAFEKAKASYRARADLLGLADAFSYQGTAYMSSGDWQKAQEAYNESIRAASQALSAISDDTRKARTLIRLASAANQAAQVAVMWGDATQARGLARKALEIWERLSHKHGQAEARMTLSRIAEMEGEFTFAAMHLNLAIEHYQQGDIPSSFGLARATAFLARVRRRQEQLDEAEKLIQESRSVFEWLGKKQQQAFALSEWGTILRSKKYFTEAEDKFWSALRIARESGDKYREAEVLEDLALLALERGDSPGEIEIHLREAERAATEGGYSLFLGRVKEHRGEMAFFAGNFHTAFSHYVEACQDLVQYHPDFYRRFINKVENRLFELPWDQIPKYADEVTEYWRDHGLAEDHPQLVQRMDAAKNLAQSLLCLLGAGG